MWGVRTGSQHNFGPVARACLRYHMCQLYLTIVVRRLGTRLKSKNLLVRYSLVVWIAANRYSMRLMIGTTSTHPLTIRPMTTCPRQILT